MGHVGGQLVSIWALCFIGPSSNPDEVKIIFSGFIKNLAENTFFLSNICRLFGVTTFKGIIYLDLCFFKWAIPGLFFLYFRLFNTQLTVNNKQMFNKNKVLPMTGFELQTSGIGSDRSNNWTTTTTPDLCLSFIFIFTASRFGEKYFGGQFSTTSH